MSVILFSKSEVYKDLADSYEGLKHLLRPYHEVDDERFYKSLRRLYFANVATFLCQYHDDSPLGNDELTNIDPFIDLEGKNNVLQSSEEKFKTFLSAWDSLQYNCITNDGENYQAKEAKEYIELLISVWTRKVIEQNSQATLN